MTQSQTPLNLDQNGRGERHLSNESFTDSDSRYQPDGIGKQPITIQSQKTTEEEKTDTNEQKPPSPRGKKRPRRKQLIFTAVGVGAIAHYTWYVSRSYRGCKVNRELMEHD